MRKGLDINRSYILHQLKSTADLTPYSLYILHQLKSTADLTPYSLTPYSYFNISRAKAATDSWIADNRLDVND